MLSDNHIKYSRIDKQHRTASSAFYSFPSAIVKEKILDVCPEKISEPVAMLVPMLVTDVLRTEDASSSRVHGFSSHTRFGFPALPSAQLRCD